MVGSDGRLWVGYFDRGLDVLAAAGGVVNHVENEHVFCVSRIVEDAKHGSVDVATANGLVLFDNDGRQKQVLGREAGLIAEHVTDVALYGDGMALATPAGITFLDNTGAHSLYAFQGLVNNHVYVPGASRDQASPDRSGQDQLVAGTLGGLSILAGGQIRRSLTTATSGLKHNWITGLAAVGNEWLVGTYGAGVSCASGPMEKSLQPKQQGRGLWSTRRRWLPMSGLCWPEHSGRDCWWATQRELAGGPSRQAFHR